MNRHKTQRKDAAEFGLEYERPISLYKQPGVENGQANEVFVKPLLGFNFSGLSRLFVASFF